MENWCNDTAWGAKPAPMPLCSLQTKRERERGGEGGERGGTYIFDIQRTVHCDIVL